MSFTGRFSIVRGIIYLLCWVEESEDGRLDRFLSSQEWIDYFGLVTQVKLPKLMSDHAPFQV